MKLQHHLGGLEGLGPVNFEKRVFVEPWEKRIFGIHVAMMALSSQLPLAATPSRFNTVWTWADLRKGAEAMNPFDYFKFRYYEKWLGGISAYCVEQGYLSADELAQAAGQFHEGTGTPPSSAGAGVDDQVIRYLREGDSPRRGPATPRFLVGETVLVADPPHGAHTRLPGYLRGHRGVIHTVAEGSYTYFCSTGGDGLGDPVPV